ncbi:MAG: hypothetical protein ACI8PV_000956 [Dinoroseobacter sp.]|jgi:hypothetical protein
MFIKTTMCLVLFIVLASASPAHPRSTKLHAPLSFKVTNSNSIELLDRAVEGALAEKQWTQETVTKSVPRNMHAVLVVGGHKIWSEIEYDRMQITLSYLDSENMNYREKKDNNTFIPVTTNGLKLCLIKSNRISRLVSCIHRPRRPPSHLISLTQRLMTRFQNSLISA